jgi:hypothetical protein
LKKKILICYNKTLTTPGRYLEEGFRKLGIPIEVETDSLHGDQLSTKKYLGVIFVESPSPPKAFNMEACEVPRLFWIHHGKHHLQQNLELVKQYRPNMILMAHSLHLSKYFPVPARFFPFAVADNLFNHFRRWDEREYCASFVGRSNSKFYKIRNRNIRRIRLYLQDKKLPCKFTQNVTPEEMSVIYSKSKIVFNQSSEKVPETMNMRIFEALGCGALLVTNEVPLQRRLFKDGIHYVKFTSPKDLMRKVKYFLSHPKEACEIARQGHEYALKHHTYAHRAELALKILKGLSNEK